MQQFIAKHQGEISGVLSGFDRLVMRGTLRSIAYPRGMNQYLWNNQILLKDFGAHVEQVSQQLKAASLNEAQATGRPVRYLSSAEVSKEDIARHIAGEDGITQGTVCVLTCVEPCRSFEIYRDRETKHLQLQPRIRKCLFLYHYLVHPVFGFLNARIQTWFPFSIQICLNGREWLAHQLDTLGLSYLRHDNCLPWVEDWPRAQQLLDEQLTVEWPALLDGIARTLNPIHDEIFRAHPTRYYWSTYQSEWAIDISFRTPDVLRRLYPRLLQHAMTTFGSTDVMRFLGRHIPLNGEIPKRFTGEVVSDLHQRQEGVRIKHRVNDNSVKLYDGAFSELGCKLRLLRAHGLLYKVTGTHRYHLTKAGRTVTTAILTALRSSVRQLSAAA